LVVLLGYTNDFTRTDQWQNQAQYEVGAGEVCGFRQVAEHEGEIDLVLYYGPTAKPDTRRRFRLLFEKVLAGRRVTTARYPPLVCPECHYRQERAVVVRRTQEGRGFLFCSNCGRQIPLAGAAAEVVPSAEELRLLDQEQATAGLRTKFEAALV